MKANFTFIICCLCFYTLAGQQTNIDMCDVIRHSLINKNSDSITNLLQLDPSKLTNTQRADLYSIRGRMSMVFNKKEINKSSSDAHPALVESYEDLTKAITLIPDEKDKLKYVARRFYIFEDYATHYTDFQSDTKVLVAHGMKKDKTCFGASVVTRYDGDLWAGVEVSLFSGYAPTFKVKDDDGNIVLHKKYSVSASALVLGFTRNLDTPLNDFNFSLLRIEAPVFIDLTKVGFIASPGGTNSWYYRPEIGIGYSIFHLSGGFNIFFKSEGSEDLSDLNLNFRIKYTF
jgi:hypothetical protein